MSFLRFTYKLKDQQTTKVFYKDEYLGTIKKTDSGWVVDKPNTFFRSKKVAAIRLLVLNLKETP